MLRAHGWKKPWNFLEGDFELPIGDVGLCSLASNSVTAWSGVGSSTGWFAVPSSLPRLLLASGPVTLKTALGVSEVLIWFMTTLAN